MMEANNLPDTELKALVIKMLREHRGRADEPSENFNKEITSKRKDIKPTKYQK